MTEEKRERDAWERVGEHCKKERKKVRESRMSSSEGGRVREEDGRVRVREGWEAMGSGGRVQEREAIGEIRVCLEEL